MPSASRPLGLVPLQFRSGGFGLYNRGTAYGGPGGGHAGWALEYAGVASPCFPLPGERPRHSRPVAPPRAAGRARETRSVGNGMGFPDGPLLGLDPFCFPGGGLGLPGRGIMPGEAGRGRAGAGPGVSGRRVRVFLL